MFEHEQKSEFKGQVQCFSMHVVMNKCFLLNPEKNLTKIRLVVFEKNAKSLNSDTLQFRKHDVPDPKTRRLGYSFNQLNCYLVKGQFQAFGNFRYSAFA